MSQSPKKHFSRKEVDTAIKALKRNKSTGPNRIPNEVLIESTENK